jgi:hypothetical protein
MPLGNVLVQPEMETGRARQVNIPPFGRGFSKHQGLPIRCGLLNRAALPEPDAGIEQDRTAAPATAGLPTRHRQLRPGADRR